MDQSSQYHEICFWCDNSLHVFDSRVVKIIVLELKPNTDWFENMSLPRADDDRVHTYTTINLTTDQVKEQVVIGSDNYGYGPLKPNTKYAFYVQWISEDEVRA